MVSGICGAISTFPLCDLKHNLCSFKSNMLHGDFELKLKSLMLSKNKLSDLLFCCFNMQVSTYIRKTLYMVVFIVLSRVRTLDSKINLNCGGEKYT